MAPTKPVFTGAGPLLSLVGMEWRIGWRTTAFRFVLLLTFVLGCTVGGKPGLGVAAAAYEAADTACQALGFLTIVWVSLVAVRETTVRTAILVFSKPQPAARLATAKFLGTLLQAYAFLLSLFVGSIVGRLIGGGGLLGIEVYLMQYLRAAIVLFFAASASFTLALLFDNAIAGVMIALYWVLTLAGKAFLGKYYFPSYSQNQAAFLALGVGLLCLTLLLYRRSNRGNARPALWAILGAPACVFLAVWLLWTHVREGYDPHVGLNPALQRMGDQDVDRGDRAAGFLLPDQNGKLVGLADFPGKILVIVVWSPHDPDSIVLLDRLNEVQERYSAQGVQPIAITVSEDDSAMPTFARGERLKYPIVMDWGTSSVPDKAEASPLSSAYRVDPRPKVIVTDRRRRVHFMMNGTDSYDGNNLDFMIQDRLKAEPR